MRPTWILTAAHCASGQNSRIDVRMGGTNQRQLTYAETANLKIVHEAYNRNTLANDVALLRLPRAATGSEISTIPMTASNTGPLVGVPMRASGYGNIRNGGPLSQDLLKADLQGISNDECRRTFQAQLIQESTLCARPANNRQQSVCNGDSGGPLTAQASNGQHVLVGVVSFVTAGSRGCEMGSPQGFARVSSFNEWANRNMNRF